MLFTAGKTTWFYMLKVVILEQLQHQCLQDIANQI